jgi:hypothetical protein
MYGCGSDTAAKDAREAQQRGAASSYLVSVQTNGSLMGR